MINGYGSRGWQLDKLQRLKLRDLQQNYKLLKEIYSWVLNKEGPEPRQKNETLIEESKYWVQYKNPCLIDGILYSKHQLEPNFMTVCQMLVP